MVKEGWTNSVSTAINYPVDVGLRLPKKSFDKKTDGGREVNEKVTELG